MNNWGKIAGIGALALLCSCAFGLALGFGLSMRGGSGEAEAATSGAAGNVIAVTTDGVTQRMYVIDTETKAILVYEGPSGGRGFTLVAGRTYEVDREYMRQRELSYNARGYTIRQVQTMLQKSTKP